MKLIAQHVSPDGLLTLKVQRESDDSILGFNSYAWSTSSGFLASKWGVTREAAVAHFLGELLGNRAIIAIAHTDQGVRDVWITDRPASELKYKRHEETIRFRFWDGSPWESDEASSRAGE